MRSLAIRLIRIGLLLVVSVALVGCPGPENPDHLELQQWVLFCAYFGPPGPSPTVTYTATDLADGIIRVRKQVVGGSSGRCSLAVNPSSTETTYVRKCLLGQTYQVGPNDCRGTGSAGDNYGADGFTRQFCGTNDASCETNGLASATTSPAAQACAALTAGGHTWRLPARAESFATDGTLLSSLHSLTPDIPLSYSFWSNSVASGTQAYSLQKTAASSWTATAQNKTTANHVWCFASGGTTYP